MGRTSPVSATPWPIRPGRTRRCSSRILSVILADDSRTSSANGARGLQERHPSVQLQTAGAPSLRAIAVGVNERKIPADGGTGG